MTPLDIAVRARSLLTRPRLAAGALAALAGVTIFSPPALAQPAGDSPSSAPGRPAAASPAIAPARPATTVTPNGLAATPPMGWNDWYSFGCNVSASLIEQTAQAMVTSGMKAAGYQYVNIDDCWLDPQRAADGSLQADPAKFPDGHQGRRRLRARPGPEARHLRGRRHEDLRRLPGQLRPLPAGCADAGLLGHRFRQDGLVQRPVQRLPRADAAAGRGEPLHRVRPGSPGDRTADPVQHLRMESEPAAVDLGAGDRQHVAQQRRLR